MDPAGYFLLFLLGLAVYSNNQKQQSATERPKVEVIENVDAVEEAKPIEQTTISTQSEKDLCDEFANVEPSLGKYQLIVDAANGKYSPNTRYKVSLVCDFETGEEVPVFTRFFINGRTQLHNKFCRQIDEQSDTGIFLPLDEKSVINKFHANTVSEATNDPKTLTEIAWIAPKTGSGCVFISAIPHNNGTWYKDLENLFQIVCENKIIQ